MPGVPVPPTLAAFEGQLSAVENRLKAQLEQVRSALHHPGNKGASAEGAFRRALADYLPRKLQVGHGEIIDTRGERSAQCDVVVVTDSHPSWFQPDSPSLFLIEGVAAVAEVKSVLTSRHLDTSLANVQRFRRLKPDWAPRTEFVGNEADVRRYYRSPPFFVFAYESELSLDTVTERIVSSSHPRDGRPGESLDGLFTLDRGYVLNFGEGDGAFVSQDASGDRLKGFYWDDRKSPLLTLMMWLPTTLVTPLTQIPILSSYLLGDASRTQRAV